MRSMDAKKIADILIEIHGSDVFSLAESCLAQAEKEPNAISISAWRAVLKELGDSTTGKVLFMQVVDNSGCGMDIDLTGLRDRSRRFRSLAETHNDLKTKRTLIDTADELETKAN